MYSFMILIKVSGQILDHRDLSIKGTWIFSLGERNKALNACFGLAGCISLSG